MASANVPKAGLRNTLRLKWKHPATPMMQREVFGRLVIMEKLKLTVADILCLQTNPQERSFDVTFHTAEVVDRVLEAFRVKGGEKPFSDFHVDNLDRPNFRLVTVQMYNPYVTRDMIASFLSYYGEVFDGSKKVVDNLGFWTGRLQFQMLLREDPNGFEGLAHPPAYFNIGADRGYLFYARQPPFCRRCRKVGHKEGACVPLVQCSRCKAVGHDASWALCPGLPCRGCGGFGHLERSCPKRRKSYAEVARVEEPVRGREPEPGPSSAAGPSAARGPSTVPAPSSAPGESETAVEEVVQSAGPGTEESQPIPAPRIARGPRKRSAASAEKATAAFANSVGEKRTREEDNGAGVLQTGVEGGEGVEGQGIGGGLEVMAVEVVPSMALDLMPLDGPLSPLQDTGEEGGMVVSSSPASGAWGDADPVLEEGPNSGDLFGTDCVSETAAEERLGTEGDLEGVTSPHGEERVVASGHLGFDQRKPQSMFGQSSPKQGGSRHYDDVLGK